MRKWDYCKQYKECIKCPKSNVIQGDKYDSYFICEFHLRSVRDEIDKILKEQKNEI